ncbi:MAG TPA: metallophosphoesterase [Tissierellia bacterium]|nr:metallophosphoesterase [Tissierellia bacterium]
MKILVISDSHNVILDSQIEDIKKEGPFDLLIHCGDKYGDAAKFGEKLNIEKILNMPGNCDFDYNFLGSKLSITEEIEGKKFFITHGHMYFVKTDLSKLMAYARKNKIDVVVYGHTHKSQNKFIDNILYFNPGSTVFPKDGKASFGIIEIKEGNINSSIVSMEN